MTAASTLPPTLNSHEQALAQYRSISKLSLVALGLGLASALVLVNPLLAPVPLLAVAVAVLSLRGIRLSGGQVVGRVPAIAGLCLATFFLGWGISARFSRAWTVESHARQLAEGWLKMIAEGDLEQADQLRKPSHNRMRSDDSRQEFYRRNPDALAEMSKYFATPTFRDFIAQGEEVKYRFDALTAVEQSTLYDRLVLRYTFDDARSERRPIWITVRRQIHVDHIDWQIENATSNPDS
jgi:hypothetical protein